MSVPVLIVSKHRNIEKCRCFMKGISTEQMENFVQKKKKKIFEIGVCVATDVRHSKFILGNSFRQRRILSCIA